LVALDQYDRLARDTIHILPQDDLARLYRTSAGLAAILDQERREHTQVVAALLELVGGRAVLPRHAVDGARGYQIAHGDDGALILQVVGHNR